MEWFERDLVRADRDRRSGREQIEEVVRRLRAVPGISAVAYASDVPGEGRYPRALLEFEEDPRGDGTANPIVGTVTVGRGFFEAMETPALEGRTPDFQDHAAGSSTVVVSEAFVHAHMRGLSPIGRRIRYLRRASEQPGPWHEIVGVTQDLVRNQVNEDATVPMIFHPVREDEDFGRMGVVVRTRLTTGPMRLARGESSESSGPDHGSTHGTPSCCCPGGHGGVWSDRFHTPLVA